jgi:hypothetical protein
VKGHVSTDLIGLVRADQRTVRGVGEDVTKGGGDGIEAVRIRDDGDGILRSAHAWCPNRQPATRNARNFAELADSLVASWGIGSSGASAVTEVAEDLKIVNSQYFDQIITHTALVSCSMFSRLVAPTHSHTACNCPTKPKTPSPDSPP